MKDVCDKYNVAIGIIATPEEVAEEIADKLVDSGIKSILNFAPAMLKTNQEYKLDQLIFLKNYKY